jgi:cytochrome c
MEHPGPARRTFALLAICALALPCLPLRAQEDKYASRAEAQALVKKAIEYYRKNGRDKAIAEFVRNPGPFVDRDLYITVYTMAGDALAHINPKIVGKNMLDLRDGDGKYHIRERMEAAAKGTSGWQDLKFFNPVTKKIEPKEMYWEKFDSLVFACGAYKAP